MRGSVPRFVRRGKGAGVASAWILAALLVAAAPARAGGPPCRCETVRVEDGWCEAHEVGYLASVPIRSRVLFEALDAHGHVLAPAALECEVCREARNDGGFCDVHRIGFVDGLAYFSRLTYHLARGERLEPADAGCPECRPNREEPAWCEPCGKGWIGNVAIRDREEFESAREAFRILLAAVRKAEACELCAAAMAVDGDCPVHRIRYRSGARVDPPPPQGGETVPSRRGR